MKNELKKFDYPENLILDIFQETSMEDLFNNNPGFCGKLPDDIYLTIVYLMNVISMPTSTNMSEDKLTRNSYMVMEYYIGKFNYSELASKYSLTNERIRQLLKLTLAKIRKYKNILQMGIISYVSNLEKEAKVVKGEFIKPYDDAKVIDFTLSTRSKDGLRRAGIGTVKEVKEAFESGDILKVRNLGKDSLTEIATVILGESDFDYMLYVGKMSK